MLLLLFILSAYSCDIARVVQCASNWYDWNHDGIITDAEIKRFMIEKPCGQPNFKFMGSTAIKLCDTNHDGVLTSADAYDVPMSCLLNESLLRSACTECDRCDSHGSKK